MISWKSCKSRVATRLTTKGWISCVFCDARLCFNVLALGFRTYIFGNSLYLLLLEYKRISYGDLKLTISHLSTFLMPQNVRSLNDMVDTSSFGCSKSPLSRLSSQFLADRNNYAQEEYLYSSGNAHSWSSLIPTDQWVQYFCGDI